MMPDALRRAVPIDVHESFQQAYSDEMADSGIKETVELIEEQLRNNKRPACDMYEVRGAYIRHLFETLKRYGGRKDWTPVEPNIQELPGPVRRHIRNLEVEIQRLQRALVRSGNKLRKAEAVIEIYRHPPADPRKRT